MQNTASVLIGPVTTTLNLRSDPPGAQLALDTGDVTTPADHAVIAGSAHQLIAPEILVHRSFSAWADGESARVRSITIGTTPLTYTATYVNRPPAASASVTPGLAPFAATFAVAQAADPEGDALAYHWEFGDRQAATSASATHTYASPGSYSAALAVSDELELTSRYSFTVAIEGQGNVTNASRLVRLPLMLR